MNHPCPLCADLMRRKTLAFIKDEHHEFDRLSRELEQHQTRCDVTNSLWYRNLWGGAPVIVVAVPAVR